MNELVCFQLMLETYYYCVPIAGSFILTIGGYFVMTLVYNAILWYVMLYIYYLYTVF